MRPGFLSSLYFLFLPLLWITGYSKIHPKITFRLFNAVCQTALKTHQKLHKKICILYFLHAFSLPILSGILMRYWISAAMNNKHSYITSWKKRRGTNRTKSKNLWPQKRKTEFIVCEQWAFWFVVAGNEQVDDT